MNPLHYVFLGGCMLCIAFVLRRTSKRVQANRTPTAAVTPVASPNGPADRLHELELRLYDFSREVEGRMDTKLTVLDELIAEADREITELRQVVPPDKRLEISTSRPVSSLSADQIHMADCLFGAGFQVDEIARAMNCQPAEIARSLALDPPDSAAA